MSLREIIDWRIAEADGNLFGTIASDFYQFYDTEGQWVWACDVDIGQDQPLRNVPVANNCREILYAQIGMPVALTQMGPTRYAITGLSKKIQSTTRIIYVSFADAFGSIVNVINKGFIYRLLTYGEIGTLMPGMGYGLVPYGLRGKFDMQGNLIELLRSF